ncbi:helix-turn-helix transcriptional regulator [Brucella sp. C7-11G]
MTNQTEDLQLISVKDVCKLTSLSRATINIVRKDGSFPKAISLGPKRVAFLRSEVEGWIRSKAAGRAA